MTFEEITAWVNHAATIRTGELSIEELRAFTGKFHAAQQNAEVSARLGELFRSEGFITFVKGHKGLMIQLNQENQ